MGLFRSIMLLAGVVCCIAFAYFFGHGLSTGRATPWVIGAVVLAVGVVLLAVYHKTGGADGAAASRH